MIRGDDVKHFEALIDRKFFLLTDDEFFTSFFGSIDHNLMLFTTLQKFLSTNLGFILDLLKSLMNPGVSVDGTFIIVLKFESFDLLWSYLISAALVLLTDNTAMVLN